MIECIHWTLVKGLSQKYVKSITFTFVSQFDSNFEIKFLIVYWDCSLTLMFQKESRFPENQTFRKSFFPSATHVPWHWGYVHLITRSLLHIAYFRNWKQNLPSTGNAGAETVRSLAIKHHVIKQPTILCLAMAEGKLRVSDLNWRFPLGPKCGCELISTQTQQVAILSKTGGAHFFWKMSKNPICSTPVSRWINEFLRKV